MASSPPSLLKAPSNPACGIIASARGVSFEPDDEKPQIEKKNLSFKIDEMESVSQRLRRPVTFALGDNGLEADQASVLETGRDTTMFRKDFENTNLISQDRNRE